jgi:hypothetical protein
MTKNKTIIGSVLLLVGFLFFNACIKVHVVQNVRNPNRYFRRAMRQIEVIQRRARWRREPARSLHALVYERDERKLFKVVIPLGAVSACLDIGVWTEDELDLRELERRHDFDWKGVQNDGEAEPGLAAQFKDEDSRVLVWYE